MKTGYFGILGGRMYECQACGEGPVDVPSLCVDCARVFGSDAPMARSAVWAMSALQRWQRHPGSDPFVLWASSGKAGVDAIPGSGPQAVGHAHDWVRNHEPLAYAFLGRGAVRTRDFGFDPSFASKVGARRAAVVIAAVQGHPLALVVGLVLDEERPTFFQQIPTWLGLGPVVGPAPVGALDVSIRLKS